MSTLSIPKNNTSTRNSLRQNQSNIRENSQIFEATGGTSFDRDRTFHSRRRDRRGPAFPSGLFDQARIGLSY